MYVYILIALTIAVSVWGIYHMVFDPIMRASIIGKFFGVVIGFPLILALAGFTIGFVLGAPVFLLTDEHPEKAGETQLQAIQMGEGINGRFFIGSGYINEQNVYTYYAKNEDGTYQSGRISADNAKIVETDKVEPHIVTYDYYKSGWVAPRWMGHTGHSYILYVPVGSIKPMIDMELPK